MAMTIEQQRALALAQARLRTQQGQGAMPSSEARDAIPGPWLQYAQPEVEQLDEQPPSAAQRLGQAALSTGAGIAQGATLGAYDEIASLLGTPVKAIENLITGKDHIGGVEDIGGFIGRSYGDSQAGQQAVFDAAREADPVAYTAGDVAGSLALGGGVASQGGGLLTNVARPTIAGMAGRGAAEGAMYGAASGFNRGETPRERIVDALSGGLMGAGTGAVLGGVSGWAGARNQAQGVPSVQQLQDDAAALYRQAEASGAQASPTQAKSIANNMQAIARSENIVTPSGRVNTTYPRINAALNTFEDYAQGPVSVGQMQALRRNLQDAVRSADAGEQRIGMLMLNQFDDWVAGIAPELREASGLYSRMKAGELIQRTMDLASTRAGQFSQSGMENALRTEFRNLDRQIIKGTLKGITPELSEAISHVANGGSLQTFARNVGKLAPTGPVSFGLGTGVPFAIGNAIGGPTAGGLIGAGVAGTGIAGRQAATNMAINNAGNASLIARQGGALPAQDASELIRMLIVGGASSMPDF